MNGDLVSSDDLEVLLAAILRALVRRGVLTQRDLEAELSHLRSAPHMIGAAAETEARRVIEQLTR